MTSPSVQVNLDSLTCALRRLCAAVLLAVLLCAGGCERAPTVGGEAPVALRFWNGFTGPDGRTMLAIVKQFNQANPDVHVTMQRMDWGIYYNKLFVARLGGRGPDVFVLHTDSIPRFQHAGFLRPMDDLLTDSGGIPPADFDANILQGVTFDSHRVAVPLDVHLIGLFYNKKMFRDAGIVDAQGNPKPPTNRAEFLDAARRMTRTNGPVESIRWGFMYTWLRTNCYTLMRQWGGDILTPDGRHAAINSPECIDAMQFAYDLIGREKVAPSPGSAGSASVIGFRQGKVGMVFEGVYMLPEFRRQTDLEWGAAPVPQLGAQKAAWCNSHNLCISPDATGRELDAARRFVKYLSDHSLDWCEAGQIPVRKSLRNSERFQEMTAQKELAKQIPYAAYMPRVQFVNEYMAEYEPAIEKVLYGSVTPKQALDTAAANIERVIRRFEPEPAVASGEARR